MELPFGKGDLPRSRASTLPEMGVALTDHDAITFSVVWQLAHLFRGDERGVSGRFGL